MFYIECPLAAEELSRFKNLGGVAQDNNPKRIIGIIPLGLLIHRHSELVEALRSELELYLPRSCFTLSEASAQLRIRVIARNNDKYLQNTLKINPTVLITSGAALFYPVTSTVANGQEDVRRSFFFIFSSLKTLLKPSPRCRSNESSPRRDVRIQHHAAFSGARG